VREAYEREFERYLVRMFLEENSWAAGWYLDEAKFPDVPVEARLLAALALEPEHSVPLVAKYLPQLQRPPGREEVLRLAQFPNMPGVGDALRACWPTRKLETECSRPCWRRATRLDATKLTPMLSEAAREMLESKDSGAVQRGVRLADEFKLATLNPNWLSLLGSRPIRLAFAR
jgi:hypothetical protein